jgi:uncharacterized protein (DUF2384 family)
LVSSWHFARGVATAALPKGYKETILSLQRDYGDAVMNVTPRSGKVGKPVKKIASATPAVKTSDIYGATQKLKGHKAFVVFRNLYRSAPVKERMLVERRGLPSVVVKGMIVDIGLSDADFQRTVRIPKASYAKKMKQGALFDGAVGHSAINIIELINKVEEMVRADMDNADAKHFDAGKWVGEWIRMPQPGLGGSTPAELLDTPSGRESVMRLLGSIQSGAYQ